MKERPILFSGAMVRALLAGEKTQTRRVVKLQPTFADVAGLFAAWQFKKSANATEVLLWPNAKADVLALCPYGQPGDRLYVRETFAKIIGQSGGWIETDYQATYRHGDRLGDSLGIRKKWTPSIHMPREASRILLEITAVRVEQLNECSDTDCVAEGIGLNSSAVGVQMTIPVGETLPHAAYRSLWESINGAGSWAANPFVWVVEFKRVMPPAPGTEGE